MRTRTRKMAIEFLSDIGSAAFELQTYDDAEVLDALIFMGRHVNPELFRWLSARLTDWTDRLETKGKD